FQELNPEELREKLNEKIREKINATELQVLKNKLEQTNFGIKNITKTIEMEAYSNELLLRLTELEQEKKKLESDIRTKLSQINSLKEITLSEAQELTKRALEDLNNPESARKLLLNLIDQITVDFDNTKIIFVTKFGEYTLDYHK
ncbi:MAG: hypothetical protein J7J43_04350, partial [Thermosipho sp. (in: Bacteria)]|nr:hypothetical protein [Thermosipho sp. (in: thermotogales)]